MSKLKQLLHSPRIHVALATGLSIVVLAYVSKRILPEPIRVAYLAIPPLLMTFHEYVLNRYPETRMAKTAYWVMAIFAATVVVILVHV
ncbi:MAG: hypothetical protein KDH97_20025 [Calditrichaeota bacterium]|nr:hypothetical protein [Calditrichota bacterium]